MDVWVLVSPPGTYIVHYIFFTVLGYFYAFFNILITFVMLLRAILWQDKNCFHLENVTAVPISTFTSLFSTFFYLNMQPLFTLILCKM